MQRNPNSWRLIAMFFVMAMFFAMGPINGNASAPNQHEISIAVNSPPAFDIVVANENSQSQTVVWLCTSTPGVNFNASVGVSDAILFTDTPSVECNIYYTIEEIDLKPRLLNGFKNEIDKYPFASDLGVRYTSQGIA
jgi:hypothetical protein